MDDYISPGIALDLEVMEMLMLMMMVMCNLRVIRGLLVNAGDLLEIFGPLSQHL